jgi:D-aminopeptidase
MRPGPRNLITDVAGLLVGHAADALLKSGVTVLTADAPFVASVHVMGGAPGTRETDLLAPDKSVEAVDALVLSGGSAFGLDACSGVVASLREMGRGLPVGPARVPIVPGAIVFDLLNGGDKGWTENPYARLGREAFAARATDFALGTAGAGTGALTAMLKGGLGSASLVLDDGTTVGALVVANPVGSATTPGERHFWAAPFEVGAEFGGLGPDPRGGLVGPTTAARHASWREHHDRGRGRRSAKLSKAGCERMAVAAHDGIARAVVPAHTPTTATRLRGGDGTGAPGRTPGSSGAAAAHCLARASPAPFPRPRPAPGDLLPCWAPECPGHLPPGVSVTTYEGRGRGAAPPAAGRHDERRRELGPVVPHWPGPSP